MKNYELVKVKENNNYTSLNRTDIFEVKNMINLKLYAESEIWRKSFMG